VSEISFINTLEAQNRKLEVQDKYQVSSSTRLGEGSIVAVHFNSKPGKASPLQPLHILSRFGLSFGQNICPSGGSVDTETFS